MKQKRNTMWIFPIALVFMLFASACQLPVDTGRMNNGDSFSPDSIIESRTFANTNELKSFLAGITSAEGSPAPMMRGLMAMSESAVQFDSSGSGSKVDFSGTNVQVEGVDEADIIKTDGKYIYTVSENTLFIIEAYPGEEARLLSKITLNNSPQGIFLYENRIAVFGTSYNYDNPMAYWNFGGNTIVETYDLTDKEAPVLEDNYELEGNFVQGRMINNNAYLIVRSNVDSTLPMPTPLVIRNGAESRILPRNIHYYGMPYTNPEFATIHMIDMNSGDLVSESVLVEGGETVYMSQNNLYLATTQYINEWEIRNKAIIDVVTPMLNSEEKTLISSIEDVDSRILSDWEKEQKKFEIITQHLYGLEANEQDDLQKEVDSKVKTELDKYDYREYTLIHKISVDGQTLRVENTATLPGRLNNQFAMDEYNNILRVATTTTELVSSFKESDARVAETSMIWNGNQNSENHVFTLDSEMSVLDSVSGIAKGESIFSTRFMGDRLYMVTFRQVDPFFAIDLSNPENIEVLGELKIPGFSRYLHPYDDNLIIGLGRDGTDEGRVLGLKISLFDVSNPENPRERATYTLSGEYSSSIAEWEHKAFLFSKEKNLLVIPAYSYDSRTGGERFTGALVFTVSENGIDLKGLVDHSRAGSWNGVERSLYIEELLYTKSPSLLRINNIESLDSVKEIQLVQESKTDIPVY